MTLVADFFPVVETPPFRERFVPAGPHSSKVECVLCGERGFPTNVDAPRWWTATHRDHVMCSCGKVTSKKGLGQHRSAKRRHGKPCPPVEGVEY